MNILEVKDLSKKYQSKENEILAIDNINFSIKKTTNGERKKERIISIWIEKFIFLWYNRKQHIKCGIFHRIRGSQENFLLTFCLK